MVEPIVVSENRYSRKPGQLGPSAKAVAAIEVIKSLPDHQLDLRVLGGLGVRLDELAEIVLDGYLEPRREKALAELLGEDRLNGFALRRLVGRQIELMEEWRTTLH